MTPLPVPGSWAIDYSPAHFSYWACVDREGLRKWIEDMNAKHPDPE